MAATGDDAKRPVVCEVVNCAQLKPRSIRVPSLDRLLPWRRKCASDALSARRDSAGISRTYPRSFRRRAPVDWRGRTPVRSPSCGCCATFRRRKSLAGEMTARGGSWMRTPRWRYIPCCRTLHVVSSPRQDSKVRQQDFGRFVTRHRFIRI